MHEEPGTDPDARPFLCGHHAGILASLDHPTGSPVVDAPTRDTWARQFVDSCCATVTARPTPRQETQP